MNALALTDHGNLHGVLKFYQQAKELGIKPILGMEAYIARQPVPREASARKRPATT
jgi:DNA polymerase-3 subunit alpha